MVTMRAVVIEVAPAPDRPRQAERLTARQRGGGSPSRSTASSRSARTTSNYERAETVAARRITRIRFEFYQRKFLIKF
jgi:hypothetical protein